MTEIGAIYNDDGKRVARYVPSWKGCCEHCGTRLKRAEKTNRFCQKCVDEGVYEDYYAEGDPR
jgi:hypothetical protein